MQTLSPAARLSAVSGCPARQMTRSIWTRSDPTQLWCPFPSYSQSKARDSRAAHCEPEPAARPAVHSIHAIYQQKSCSVNSAGHDVGVRSVLLEVLLGMTFLEGTSRYLSIQDAASRAVAWLAIVGQALHACTGLQAVGAPGWTSSELLSGAALVGLHHLITLARCAQCSIDHASGLHHVLLQSFWEVQLQQGSPCIHRPHSTQHGHRVHALCCPGCMVCHSEARQCARDQLLTKLELSVHGRAHGGQAQRSRSACCAGC